MKSIKYGIILFVSFLLTFLTACTTPEYVTNDGLLDSNVSEINTTSSLDTSILLPTTTIVPSNVSKNNYPRSEFLGSNIISEQDILAIDVYKNPDLTRTIQVDNSGNISFPLLSRMYVKGLSPTQLAKRIKQGLEKDYLVSAYVNVLIKKSNKNQFTIEGSVKKSGVYPVTGKTTILQAIARAGGLSKDADEHHATLLRQSPEGEIVKDTIDIAAIRRGRLQDFLLVKGDRIVIQKSIYNRVTVSGGVKRPGIFPLTEGVTVMQAITLAGGFNSLAHKDHIVVLRRNKEDNSFKKYRVNIQNIRSGYAIDPDVQPDDRLVVLESSQRILLDELTRILAPLSSISIIRR